MRRFPKCSGRPRRCGWVRAGKLTLDGDISDVFGFRVTPAITLRQLLTHTASLRDGVYDAALESGNLPPLNELLPKSFAGYAPGTRYSYSNLGAGVAGMLVEKASGMLFDDYVRSQFFLPYGVDASFHPQRIRDAQRLANCYEMPGGQLSYHAVAIAKEPLDEQPNPLRHYIVPAGKLMISAPNLLACVRRLWLEDRDMFVHQKGIGSVPGDSGAAWAAAWASTPSAARRGAIRAMPTAPLRRPGLRRSGRRMRFC